MDGIPATVFTADAAREEGYLHVVIISTGSVASVKIPLIVEELLKVRLCQSG